MIIRGLIIRTPGSAAALLTSFTLLACATPGAYVDGSLGANNPNGLTVASAQRQIKIGMANADVVSALGSPNIITTDAESREVWVYDRTSTISVNSSSSGYWTLGIMGAGASGSASSSTQKTLTIIVKFDKAGKVRDLAYHASKF
jgi:outer membrane protein assembly factor BamE (lipoprotein component of BamABCDE complex)